MAATKVSMSGTPCDISTGASRTAADLARRSISVALVAVGLQWPLSVGSQGPGMARLGRLSSLPPAFSGSRTALAFDARLHELGWIEGKNLVIERRYSGGDLAVLQRHARELVDAKVDVIFCTSELEAEVARQVTASIPIVAAILVHPLERGLIASYAHPGATSPD